MSIDKNKPIKQLEVKYNESLPTIYCDSFELHKREDGMFLARFLTKVPEGIFEQSRVVLMKSDLNRIIDLFCRQADYYPQTIN